MDIDINAYNFDYGTTGWYDMPSRLIGFNSTVGFNEDGTVFHIRSIGPIVDRTSCELAVMQPDLDLMMLSQVISLTIEQQDYVSFIGDLTFTTLFGEVCEPTITFDTEDAPMLTIDQHQNRIVLTSDPSSKPANI